MDIFIAKYTSSGVLVWQQMINGTSNSNDAPSNLILDNLGNIFVTGTTQNTSTYTDITTIKLNNSGVIQWIKKYDFANLPDVGVSLVLDNSGNIFVCGGTANSFSNSEFTIIKYNSAGVQQSTIRNVSAGNGLDIPTAIQLNSSNNVFVTGTTENGTNKSIKTMSTNSNLNFAWSVITDRFGKTDEAFDIKILGNQAIVTGYSTRLNNSTELNVISYDVSNGNINWQYNREPENNFAKAKGRKILINGNNDIFITGEISANGSNKNTLLLGIKSNGSNLFEKSYPIQTTNSYATDINGNGASIFLSGFTQNGTTKKITNIKIQTLQVANTASVSATNEQLFVADQLIFRFKPTELIMTAIDKREVTFGNISAFVNAQLVSDLAKFTNVKFSEVTVEKIVKEFTSADSISIDRLGNQSPVPKFWASLIVRFPIGTNLKAMIDSVKHNLINRIYAVEYNWYAELSATNDPFYPTNAALKPTAQYPLSHIDVDPAWTIETGKPFVKLGVYDSGILWSHEDYGNGTFAGSVIKGGYDYVLNQPYSSTTSDPWGHGTQCAGLIGAIRNNNIGISGIAGGDASNSLSGISLYSQRFVDAGGNPVPISTLSEALIDGASDIATLPRSLGLHIMNHSWGINPTAPKAANVLDTNSTILRDAARYVFNQKVISVYARGNSASNSVRYPLTISPDDWLLSVGASGSSALTTVAANIASFSDFGSKMDLLAPGVSTLYQTTSATGNTSYASQNGTSFSAPHVAGVAGLMCSYLNQPTSNPSNITQEDAEQLIERYAYKYPNQPIYSKNANGLLQASNVFNVITAPDYKIEHFNYSFPASGATLISSNQNVTMQYDAPLIPFTEGNYKVDTYELNQTVSHTPLLPYILNSWPRNSSSNAAGQIVSSIIVPEADISLSNVSAINATISGRIYHITFNNTLNQPVDIWYPCDLSGILNFAYTLHTTSILPVGVKEIDKNNAFQIFPNPSQNVLYITTTQPNNPVKQILVYDAIGKLVYDIKPTLIDNTTYQINTQAWSNGYYNVSLVLKDNSINNFKLIKND